MSSEHPSPSLQWLREDRQRLQEQLFNAPHRLHRERCKSVMEAWGDGVGEPMALKRARVFRHILKDQQLDASQNGVFAGATSNLLGAMVPMVEYGIELDAQAQLEMDGLESLQEELLQLQRETQDFRDRIGHCRGGHAAGHLVVDYERVVLHGLTSILQELESLSYEGEEEGLFHQPWPSAYTVWWNGPTAGPMPQDKPAAQLTIPNSEPL